jgi:DNA topoisomerase-1
VKNLLIVESPTKAKKIAPMLGPEWTVKASVGHVRDLPKSGMNVDRSTYAMTYEIIAGKETVVDGLRAAATYADAVYLGTDPDREGESIAWHLEVLLGLKDPRRVAFHEITARAVKDALAKPGRIDRALVSAQETRRALDRLYGYDVSAALSRKLGAKRSAGRVQTVGLRLIVDREREILAFKNRAHHGVVLTLAGAKPWSAEWVFAPLLPAGEKLWTDTAFADRVASIRSVTVRSCEDTVKRAAPPPPFTTSTLQQVASNRLKMRTRRTMEIAQALFERGFITYHRSDSPNLSDEAVAEIRSWAEARGLALPDAKRTWKAKDDAQGAHEAIRPTHIADESPEGLTDDERAVYGLIRLRAIASQLADATFDVRTVTLDGGALDGKEIVFVARGSTLKTPGYKALVEDDEAEDGSEPEAANPVPLLAAGATPQVVAGKRLDKKTQAPPRYTEASLVKALETNGVGRPSTYSSIVERIQSAGYVEVGKDRFFRPLPPGLEVIDALKGAFAFVEIDYTKRLEERLDAIAAGSATYLDVVRDADTALVADVTKFAPPRTETAPLKIAIGKCPECGEGDVVQRARRDGSGHFWSCTRFPTCKATWPDYSGMPDMSVERAQRAPVVEGRQCPKCRSAKLRQRTRKDGSGVFWGCAGYPKCDATYPDAAGKPDVSTKAKKPRRP